MTAQRARRSRGGRGGYEPRARIVARLERAWALSVDGRTHREIAAELGVSQPAVTKMLAREAERRLAQLPRERLRLLPRHYARYELAFRLAVEGLERSRADIQRREQRRTTHGAGETDESTTISASTASAAGDPRWLRELLRALADQRTLFQAGDFDWTGLALLFDEDETGNARVNAAVLTAQDREVLDTVRGRTRGPAV